MTHEQPREEVLDWYTDQPPSAQNALDIFKGQWSSRFPDGLGLAGGTAGLFDDPRVSWAMGELGGVAGQRILELGPLEAGHTYMLERHGAVSITAVEANSRAYLKCLVVKEVLDLRRATFLFGDFTDYLRTCPVHFDACWASGVLYHVVDPIELLALIASNSKAVFLWTHYYDPKYVAERPMVAAKFSGSDIKEYGGFRCELFQYEYTDALNWSGFCGGSRTFSQWMTRADILSCLRHFGFARIEINFDDPGHPNGPSFALVAQAK